MGSDGGAEISLGLMSLRPDKVIYDAMVTFLVQSGSRLRTGVRSVDQMLQHAFFEQHFSVQGHPRWDADTGSFLGCSDRGPRLSHVPSIDGVELKSSLLQGRSLGIVCALPVRYDFCVTYPALAGIEDKPELLSQFTAQFALHDGERGEGSLEEASLRARALHWTGQRRKPWLHWLPLARTLFDDLWWQAHAKMCEDAGPGRRCVIRCDEVARSP